VAVVETPPKLEGRNMSIMLLPDKVGLAAGAKEAKRLEEARKAEEALSADPEEPDTEEADAKAEDAQGS
jgi:hypothetical protein